MYSVHTFVFNIFAVFNAPYLHNKHRTIGSSICNIGKLEKSYSVASTFKCLGCTAAVLVETVYESNRKLNKLWVDQGREFYDKLMQEWLDKNDILMYSTHNEGKSVMAERFIKTLKS